MVRVNIEKLVYQGYGLARHQGRTVFVRRAAPHDVVDVTVVQSKKDFDVASVEALIEASPERVDPPCVFFRHGCGGCQWQHIAYAAQLDWKKKIFLEFLQRSHFQPPLPPLQIHPCEPFHYRTRFHFHLTKDGQPALFREQSRELVPVDDCRLLPQPLNQLLAQLQQKPWLTGRDSFQIWMDDLGELGLETSPPLREPFLAVARGEMGGLKFLHPASPDRMEYRIGQFRFLVGEQSFFQTNRFLNSTLNETICHLLGQGSQLLDLYAGVGFFTLPVSLQFSHVIGVEENARAAAEAIDNARRNDAGNVTFLATQVEHYLESCALTFDCVLADPPRAGLSRKAVRWILEKKPQRLVYVSCDPTTLVRDVGWLSSTYRVEQFILFDLFPQTYHFEVVAQLSLRRG